MLPSDVYPWNEKYLDYEIETRLVFMLYLNSTLLETTSTSITRLKRKWVLSYNDHPKTSWNEKYLDYEIETSVFGVHERFARKLETTSTSITRLKLMQAAAAADGLGSLETTSTSITRLKHIEGEPHRYA